MNLPPFLLASAVAILVVGCDASDEPDALTPVDHALAELGEDDFSGLVMLGYDGEHQVAATAGPTARPT